MMRYIDLRSDTVTQPTEEMRQAMLEAPVGDDVYMDDPTVNRLEEEGARILGKEAALYLSSGTQSNQVAVMTWCKRGDEIIVSDGCHIYEHEVGAVAVLAGANMRTLHFEGGIPDASMIEKSIRGVDIHFPETTLICMENALSNGRVVPLSVMKEVYQVGQRHHIPVHLDGARVFNAAASLGVDVKEITQYADSVSCCLSKGLCAPIGTLLAGSREFIQRARKNRKMLGGGMRQAGVIAAPALIALTKMPARLKEDHGKCPVYGSEAQRHGGHLLRSPVGGDQHGLLHHRPASVPAGQSPPGHAPEGHQDLPRGSGTFPFCHKQRHFPGGYRPGSGRTPGMPELKLLFLIYIKI